MGVKFMSKNGLLYLPKQHKKPPNATARTVGLYGPDYTQVRGAIRSFFLSFHQYKHDNGNTYTLCI